MAERKSSIPQAYMPGRRYTQTRVGLQDLDPAMSGSTDLSGEKKDKIDHQRVESKSTIELKYTLGAKIGQGSFGTVRVIHERETGKLYALKSIRKKRGSTASVEQLQREVAIMKKVKNPHIVQLVEVYETPTKVYLLMEYCRGGELVTKIRQRRYCSENDARLIMSRLMDAIAYLHDHGVVHRDIKPENILLSTEDPDDSYNIKLSDFGLATYTDACEMMDNVCGTPFYMAPEVCSSLPYSQQCDIWSCGIILYLLLSGYRRESEQQLQQMIIAGKIEFPTKSWASISDSAKDLIDHMLRFDPAQRVTAREVLMHPWIRGETEGSSPSQHTVLDLMKSYNAERRLRKLMIFVLAAVRFRSAGRYAAPFDVDESSAESIVDALESLNNFSHVHETPADVAATHESLTEPSESSMSNFPSSPSLASKSPPHTLERPTRKASIGDDHEPRDSVVTNVPEPMPLVNRKLSSPSLSPPSSNNNISPASNAKLLRRSTHSTSMTQLRLASNSQNSNHINNASPRHSQFSVNSMTDADKEKASKSRIAANLPPLPGAKTHSNLESSHANERLGSRPMLAKESSAKGGISAPPTLARKRTSITSYNK